jgi:predicted transcriptional regulator
MFEVQRESVRAISGLAIPASNAIFGNRLLDGLPREDVARLSPLLRRVFLHRGQVLASPDEPSEFAFFPIDALVWSWQATTGAERPTSMIAIGRRGAVPLGDLIGVCADANVVVLSPGSAWRIPLSAFHGTSRSVDAPVRRLLARFAYASFASSAYALACNSEHNVDRRLARWLLFIMDETGKPEASLTHQQIADIAAIRRPSVSLAFSDLQRRGIIRVHHGLVQILERERLERETCPCYTAIRDAFDEAARDPEFNASE